MKAEAITAAHPFLSHFKIFANMKKCTNCNKLKPFEQFHKDKYALSGLSFRCKECSLIRTSKYKKTEQGLISVMYSNQKANAKKRGRKPPDYTKQEFIKWLYDNGFKYLYTEWRQSNYSKNIIPSCDRIDDYKEYTLPNIQLVTWGYNNEKHYQDVINGRNTKRAISITGKNINTGEQKEFYSLAQASRELNINRAGISNNLNGKTTTSGGYVWNYLK